MKGSDIIRPMDQENHNYCIAQNIIFTFSFINGLLIINSGMKIQLIIFTIAALSALQTGLEAQVEFTEVTTAEEMDTARQQALEQGKPLFVDVYANWCGPCKMMDRDVYTDQEVADYMNSNLINVKLDGEIPYGTQFARENGLEGYPSMFLFDREGGRMNSLVGFMEAPELLETLKSTVSGYRLIVRMDSLYAAGALEAGDYPEYLSTLRSMGRQRDAEALAANYISELSKQPAEEISDIDIRIIAPYLTMDDPLWVIVSADQDRMKGLLGDDYIVAIEQVFNRSLVKAIREGDPAIIKIISENIDRYVEGTEAEGESLEHMPYLQYYYYSGLNDQLIDYVDSIYQNNYKGDHAWLFGTASKIIDMDQQYLTPLIQEKGVEWFQTCIDLAERFDYYFYKGMCLYVTQKPEEAKAAFTKAGELAEGTEQNSLVRQVMQFIESNSELPE